LRKFLLLASLFIFVTACGDIAELTADIPAPPVIIAEPSEYIEALPYELLPPEPDIPLFNEHNISMEIEPDTRIVRGIQNIRYTNRTGEPLYELIFRVQLNAWSENTAERPYTEEADIRIFRHGRDFGFMEISHISQDNEELPFDLNGTILYVELPRALEIDETTQLRLQFEAYIPKISHRSGANDYAFWGGAFLPVEAVMGPAGFHTEPYYPIGSPFILDAANYIVEISTPVEYWVAGTGTKTETYLEDRKITTFNANMVRDFAFAVSPYFMRESIVTPSGSVEIHLYHYTEDLPMEHILNTAVSAMVFFEENVGAYPFSQLSIVETDMFINGEGFSNIIFMDSTYLRTSQRLLSLRSQIGQQWFSVIVGSNPIEEAWLSAGLTLFLQDWLSYPPDDIGKAAERLHSHIEVRLQQIYPVSGRRLSASVREYAGWTDFIAVQHQKGKLMFYSLFRVMGEENFKYLLREYYRQFAYSSATSQDFIALAEEIHEESLQQFFNMWLHSGNLPNLP